MKRDKSNKEDVKITHNNIILDTDPSLIELFISGAIEELRQKSKKTKVLNEETNSQSE